MDLTTEQIKSNWRKGFWYFCLLMFCIILSFTTPDGFSLFVGLLRILGINLRLNIGGGTLILEGLPMLVLFILSIVGMRKYWKNYNKQFDDKLNPFFCRVPHFMAVALFLMSNAVWSPSLIDRAYFAAMSRKDGIEAVSVSNFPSAATLGIHDFHNIYDEKTYIYNFHLINHSNEFLEFYIKLLYQGNKTMILDGFGEPRLFSIRPNSPAVIAGEFGKHAPTSHPLGSVRLAYDEFGFTIKLISETSEYIPRPLVRRAIYGH